MTKPLLVKLIKKKFFLNYNKVVFFKKGKKKIKKKRKEKGGEKTSFSTS